MNKTKTYRLTTCALMAALMCVLGPMSFPIGAVPITLTTFVIYLASFLLGAKGAAASCVVYIIIGAAGMPVFSGYEGGLAKLAGPTGGYIVGYIFMAVISGIVIERSKCKPVFSFIGMAVATAVTYLFGTVWFILQMDCTIGYALTVCVFPFIPFDCVKIFVAIVLGKSIKYALSKAGLGSW